MSSHGAASRNVAAAACLAGAIILLLPAVLVGYAERALFDPDQFANRATAALDDRDVRSRVATEITDRLVLANASDLTTARPVIEGVVDNVVGGAAFQQLFRASVLDVHRALFARDSDTVTLSLADAGTVVGSALAVVRPSLERRFDEDARVTLLRRHVDERAAGLARLADRADLLAALLGGLVLVLAAAAIALAADRRRAVARLGAGAVAVGVVIVAGSIVARAVVLQRVGSDDRDVAGAVWDAFLGDLRTAGWVLAGAGAVLAAAAASMLRPVALGPSLVRLRRWVVTEPARPALRVLRALALIALGVLVVADPAAAVRLLATLAGIGLIYAGVLALLRLVYDPEQAAARTGARTGRRLVVASIAVLLIAGAARAVRRRGRRERGGAGRRRLQRPPRAVRPAARSRRAPRDAQLDVGAAAGLVLDPAGRADRGSALRRDPRAADRHALRRPARRTGGCGPTSPAAAPGSSPRRTA